MSVLKPYELINGNCDRSHINGRTKFRIIKERAQPSAFCQTHKFVIDGQRPLLLLATVLEKARLKKRTEI
jgi:hypothetical protein